jgi:hypothetical protein
VVALFRQRDLCLVLTFFHIVQSQKSILKKVTKEYMRARLTRINFDRNITSRVLAAEYKLNRSASVEYRTFTDPDRSIIKDGSNVKSF